MLLEFGIVIAVGPSALRKRLPELLEDTGDELPPMCRDLAAVLRDRLSILDERTALLFTNLSSFAAPFQSWN